MSHAWIPSATSRSPSILVFDVNETHLDIDAMGPLFTQIFGDPRAVREWFGQLVVYSMTAAMSHRYVDFFALGQAVMRMLADIHRVHITDDHLDQVSEAMLTMPAHHDVADALTELRDNGLRLVALTNSPPNPDGQSPLEHAGLGGLFERQFSVDACRTFKPDPAVYRYACQTRGRAPRMHDGRRPCLGPNRSAKRGIQRCFGHPDRQRATPGQRLTATEPRRRRSAPARPTTAHAVTRKRQS